MPTALCIALKNPARMLTLSMLLLANEAVEADQLV